MAQTKIIEFELDEIEFTGNDALSSSDLESVILEIESPGWLSQFFYSFSPFGSEAIMFDSTLIPGDIQLLREYYKSQGFFETEVAGSYQLDTASLDARIVFNIVENEPYFFRNVDILGLEEIYPQYLEDIKEITEVNSDQRYSNQVVEQNRLLIMKYLRDHGYMLVQAEQPTVYIDSAANRTDIEYIVGSGRRYEINNINVDKTGVGKDLVEDELIENIVSIEPGDIYSLDEIQRGQIRLYRTNLFTSVLVTGIVADTVGDKVPINISADIGQLNELSPEIIMNNEDNAFNLGIALGFTKKNFFGSARKFSAITSAAAQDITQLLRNPSISDTSVFGYADARLIFEQPFIFGKPIYTKLEPYLTLQKRRGEYNGILQGVKLSFDFELPSNVYLNSFSTYLNWENSRYIYQDSYLIDGFSTYFERSLQVTSDSANQIASQVVSLLDDKSSKKTNSVLGVIFGANKTDDILFPTKGYTLTLQLEDGNSIPYLFSKIGNYDFSSPQYYKALLTATAYLPLYNSIEDAFGVKFKSGLINAYSGEKLDIPLNQRFNAGGSNSVRGWKTRELVPSGEGIYIPANPSVEELETLLTRGITPGGFFLFEGSFETRHRLFGNFGTALFADYGNTWLDVRDFQFKDLAVAAGFGLRYYSEFIPIRIDFGFKVYDPNNPKNIFDKVLWDVMEFHIGIGEAF
ncbi:MAG: BamA/TamA family outer membrane protein [Melioribacteraceae bacterium]|nr:BamA/TamA family outer membrane protein [Melioribacteraceae bacterium]MCF8353280.1 BamA/TamA family outer membrane protein [Melioribacteraceae bacterium]MCF8394834.1 BamA/TamA family outer membrane protein [Melioribacteraceae bacterium]MCF8418807.1 BamA/TamA family outer membrane protein [Melioribacteraceae bacterium]